MRIFPFDANKCATTNIQATNAIFHLPFALLMIIYEICLLRLFFFYIFYGWVFSRSCASVHGSDISSYAHLAWCMRSASCYSYNSVLLLAKASGIFPSEPHDNVIDVVVLGLGTEELKFFFKTKYQKNRHTHMITAHVNDPVPIVFYVAIVYIHKMGNVCFSSCKTYHARNMHYAFLYTRKHHIFSSEYSLRFFFLSIPAFFHVQFCYSMKHEKITTTTTTIFWTFRHLFVFTLYSSLRWNFIVVSNC